MTEQKHPDEYMTIGQAAQKMGVSIRTLQYYHKIGLLIPSGKSEGGRRLYTYKDLVLLHQILSLKSLGFSLEDIKERLIPLDTPAKVAKALTEQAEALGNKISQLTHALNAVECLKAEVLQMQSVDFKKYADIIVNLEMNNQYYFLIKHFDETTLDHIRRKFDAQSGIAFINKFNSLCEQILELQKNSVPQDSSQCQSLAKAFWDMIMEFTNGDMTMLPKLMEFSNVSEDKNQWQTKQALVNAYIGPALEIYFSRLGFNPFKNNPSQNT